MTDAVREPALPQGFIARGQRLGLALTRQSRRMRLALAAAAGGLAVLALPPVGLVPVLALTLPVFALLAVSARRLRGAAAIGFAFGLGHLTAGFYWISAALFTDIAALWWVLPFALFGLPALLAGLFALQALLLRWLAPPPLLIPLAAAICWLLQEALRAVFLTGFPWNPIASAWVDILPVLQLDALAGPLGLGALTVWMATLPVLWLLPQDGARRAVRVAVAALPLLLLAAGALWGALRLAAHPTTYADDAPGLRIVQAAIPQTQKWDNDVASRIVDLHLQLTTQPPPPPGTAAVLWPETAVPFFIQDEEGLLELIGRSLPPGGYLLTGAPRYESTGDPTRPRRLYNSIVAIDSTGRPAARYDKAHLVPFGEYTPLPWLPGVAARKLGTGFTPGPGPQALALPGLPAAVPLICYEAIFPAEVAAGLNPPPPNATQPAWLFNATNDAWYGNTAGPYQHFEAARMRAVEQGLPLIRAANNGISGLVDPLGRVVAELPLDARAALDVKLPQALEDAPPYSYLRDWPALGFAAFGVASMVLRRVRRARLRQDGAGR